MRKQWDRWGWIVAVAIIAVGFLRVVWGRDAFCGEQSEQCLREWVSALGGWAAVAAAVPTVIYLARQVRAADEHQRENMKIQYARTRTLAKQALKRAGKLRVLVKQQQEDWGTLINGEVETVPAHYAIAVLQELEDVIPSQFYQRFEDEIDVPDGTDISILAAQIRDAKEYVDRISGGSIGVGNFTRNRISLVYKMAHNYAGMIIELASDHLAETESIITRKKPERNFSSGDHD